MYVLCRKRASGYVGPLARMNQKYPYRSVLSLYKELSFSFSINHKYLDYPRKDGE